MDLLQVVADRPGAGKTYLIAAMLARSQELGKRVNYCKPFSRLLQEDPDPSFIATNFLAKADSPPAQFACSPPSPSLADFQAQEIKAALESLEQACDQIWLEGPDLAWPQDQSSTLSSELAAFLNSKVLLIIGYSKDLTAEAVANTGEAFGDRLVGVVINQVTKHRMYQVSHQLLPELRGRNTPVLGAIPEDRAMLAVTVEEIADYLGGRWSQEPINTGEYINRFLIGGNIMDSGPNYFGRHRNQAVITRADRPDIQMASLVGDTKCLVLTGGSEPTEYIRVEALKHEVPVILVEQDTISTVERMEGLLKAPRPISVQKVHRFSELVRDHLQQDLMRQLLS